MILQRIKKMKEGFNRTPNKRVAGTKSRFKEEDVVRTRHAGKKEKGDANPRCGCSKKGIRGSPPAGE